MQVNMGNLAPTSKAASAIPTMSDLDRAHSALQAIPPAIPRDDWVKVAMAAHAAGISFDAFDNWSAQADSYKAADTRTMWKSIQPGKGIGPATLFQTATAHGWRNDDTGYAKVQRTQDAPKPPPRPPRPGMAPAEVWGRATPATTQHAYCKTKGVSAGTAALHDLRVLPENDPLRISGHSMAGALLVPIRSAEGALLSVQCIPPTGPKMNLPGATLGDGFHVVGELVAGQPAYIVEGIGAAWAIWGDTGCTSVVTFSAGRMGTVAKAVSLHHPEMPLVLVPDVGKEAKAQTVAAELGCALVTLPTAEAWADNSDVWDYAEQNGPGSLADLLETAVAPAAGPVEATEEEDLLAKLELHPLAKFLDIDCKPRAVKWVIPGVAEYGVLTISGARGVGKTTCILPLAMAAAGLHTADYPLAPKPGRWRHVVYIVEHADQAQRIITGIVRHGGLGIRAEEVMERLHLVEAKRMDPLALVQVGKLYRHKFTRIVDGVEVPPLVVFDTKAAVLAMENENDNSEASRAIALLKQDFAGLPCWIIGHIAKANFGRTDISALSDRGAGSFEADTIQNIYLVEEKGTRYLVLGKKRFETKTPELVIESGTAEVDALDEWGDIEKTILRWGVPMPATKPRAEAREDAQAEEVQARLIEARTAALDAVDSAWRTGAPIGRTAAALATGVQKAHGLDVVTQLIEEDWLYEVDVPPKERINNRKAAFLVRLTDQERAALRTTGVPPKEKTAIPQSWRKPIPLAPAKPTATQKNVRKSGQVKVPDENDSVSSGETSDNVKNVRKSG